VKNSLFIFFLLIQNVISMALFGQEIFLPRGIILQDPSVNPESSILGELPTFQIQVDECSSRTSASDLRSFIVNAALQEWAFFGFHEVDERSQVFQIPIEQSQRGFRGRNWLTEDNAKRVSKSIAGYWSSTEDGSWIINQQNSSWAVDIDNYDWDLPWSASFISWIMCKAGLDLDQFNRSIAHYHYIDQGIMDTLSENNTNSIYTAYSVGQFEPSPGDLLCRARRSQYLDLNERIEDLGSPARGHCDVLIKMNSDSAIVIGGNVRDSVTLKLIPATRNLNNEIESIGSPYRMIYAHLKLKGNIGIFDQTGIDAIHEFFMREDITSSLLFSE
jgi:hypothetical protein